MPAANISVTLGGWIRAAAATLRTSKISTSQLDAEIILAHTLNKPRTYLHAHSNDKLPLTYVPVLDARLTLRKNRVPLAYITGHREFYGRQFFVTPAVLIPRPETETIIDWVKKDVYANFNKRRILDVGTGSGAIGISLSLELPNAHVEVTDISSSALAVAQKNIANLKAPVARVFESDLLSALSQTDTYDYIIANLPYVDQSWERSPETAHEPSLALFARSGGLEIIFALISQADRHLTPHGLLLLEADPVQHAAIIAFAQTYGLKTLETTDYLVVLQRS